MLKAVKKRLKDQRGLTLVELLAVVVILGIISAIAVPNISGIIDKTKKDAQVAEALQIINAAKLSHASNSTLTSWTHAELSSFLENVKDEEYLVEYSNGEYTIDNHDAEGVVTGAGSKLSEEELLKYTGN